ncbi:MAG: uroporphyrinogen-III synthase [Actinomycetota bacterium]
MNPRVLEGRRVVVTRAAEQADALADILRDRGAVPVVVPLVHVEPVEAGVAALAAVVPSDHDWLVITSPNGAAAWGAVHRTWPRHVAAVGTATAAALRGLGAEVELVPEVQRAEGLVTVFEAAPAHGGSVLLVQAFDAGSVAADGLRALGWRVHPVAPYRTVPAVPTAAQQLAAFSADAVLFASGSAARAWVQVLGTSGPPIVVSMGPTTTAAAQSAGLKVSVEAADHSLSGMVDALERHLEQDL